MKRCSKCIIPESAEGIVLDENGICQLCKAFKKVKPKGKNALKNDIYKHINPHAKNDCIVPVSGGRDSSYALYYAKKVLRLNPIAVHSDNDFETSVATKNLKNITNSMKVPYVKVSPKKNVIKKIVSEKFKMNAPFGPGLIVDQTCEACKYGFESAAYNTARKMGIKLIIWGDSKEESTTSYHNIVKHRLPKKSERLLSSGALNYFKYKYYFSKMKHEYGSDSPNGLIDIHIYDYIEWDRKVIVETIEKHMGWAKNKNAATSWRIDCSLVPIVDYLTRKAYGVSKIELGFSSMIRSGKMDREEALRQTEEIDKMINPEVIIHDLAKIGISEKLLISVIK